jgi:hypothetical protein
MVRLLRTPHSFVTSRATIIFDSSARKTVSYFFPRHRSCVRFTIQKIGIQSGSAILAFDLVAGKGTADEPAGNKTIIVARADAKGAYSNQAVNYQHFHFQDFSNPFIYQLICI